MYTHREQSITFDAKGRRKGIFAAAKRLGVSYGHLYQVLAGKRESARLMAIISTDCPELLSIKE